MSTSTSSLQFDSAAPDPSSWKDEVNARLAAHRTRRPHVPAEQPALPGFESGAAGKSAQPKRNVAARVAERYAKAPSYGEMLAAQAAAARAAEAAAAAAMEAHAATQAVLSGFEFELQEPHLSVVHPAPSAPSAAEPLIAPLITEHNTYLNTEPNTEIDEPYDEAASAIQPLPAKLLEFPRELVATRKARPRLAEGPLREDALTPDGSQLRIFEVEPETISKKPGVEDAVLPEWHSIRLDAKPKKEFIQQEQEKPHREELKSVFDLPLQTAPLQDRLMAGIVDVALVLAAFFVFVLVFVACTAHPPTGKAAIVGAGIALGSLCLLYQWLFFTYSDATPGMRYAKIALCTFDDENPTRKTIRNRVGALLLSALPLCLGFLWSFFDEDHLGWHDRISQTYQRSYR